VLLLLLFTCHKLQNIAFYELHQLLFQKLRVLRVMLITIGKTEGCKRGKKYFFTSNKIFGQQVKEGQIININVSE
jgi:hypothetical protein